MNIMLSICIHLADNPTGIAYCHRVGRNILHHYAACTDDATVTDGYSWANRDTTSQPAVFADGYRRASLNRFATLNIINRMIRSQELAIGTDLRVRTDGDHAPVEHRAVVVDEDVLAQLDTMPVVAMERWRNGG